MRIFYNQGAAEQRLKCDGDRSSVPHCPAPGGPSTHWLAGLEPAPLREGPPGQDDAGQRHGLPLQHPHGGGAAGDLWGGCGEGQGAGHAGSPWASVGTELHPPRPREPAQEAGSPRIPGHGHVCPKGWVVMGGRPGVSHLPPPPPAHIHQRTVSSHQEPGLRLDFPENILCFADIWGLVFRDHT